MGCTCRPRIPFVGFYRIGLFRCIKNVCGIFYRKSQHNLTLICMVTCERVLHLKIGSLKYFAEADAEVVRSFNLNTNEVIKMVSCLSVMKWDVAMYCSLLDHIYISHVMHIF